MSTYPMGERVRRSTAPVTRTLLGHDVVRQLSEADIESLPEIVREHVAAAVTRARGGVVVRVIDNDAMGGTSLLVVNRRAGTR